MAHEWRIEKLTDTCTKCGEIRHWDKERKSVISTTPGIMLESCLVPNRAIFKPENNLMEKLNLFPKKDAIVNKTINSFPSEVNLTPSELMGKLQIIFAACKRGKYAKCIRNHKIEIEQLLLTYNQASMERSLGLAQGLIYAVLKSKRATKTLKPKIAAKETTQSNIEDDKSLIYWKSRAEALELALTLMCTGQKFGTIK